MHVTLGRVVRVSLSDVSVSVCASRKVEGLTEMSIVKPGAPGILIVGQVIVEPEPDGSLAGRSIKTEVQYDQGDAGWVQVVLEGYAPGELVYLTPDNARDLAAHLTAAATIAGSPVAKTPFT
jgi:hypothetical protein